MADILIAGDEVSPVAESESAACCAALARALAASNHRVAILTLASEEHASRMSGMARRLRTVPVRMADGNQEYALFEGHSAVSLCPLQVLGEKPADRGRRAACLASAAVALVHDEIFLPSAVIAWGETAAAVLPGIQAGPRIFVLPTGGWGPSLSQTEQASLEPNAPDLAMAKGSLAGLGAIDADVVVFPSPSSARLFERAHEFSFRASDQAVVAIRFGCDEPPHDPSSDPALVTPYSGESPSGRVDCRKALARRASLALGPRTLLVATAPLAIPDGGRHIVDALTSLARSDVAIVVPARGERTLVDEIKRLSIQAPGKIAVYPELGPTGERQLLAGADVLLLGDRDNFSARTAGIAMRYGTLPLVPDCAAYRDYVVDYELTSRTGDGFLYHPGDPYEQVSVVLRAAVLRRNPDAWRPLQRRLMHLAPRWETSAAQFESLCVSDTPSV